MDADASRVLTALSLRNLTVVPVSEMETDRLRSVKGDRTVVEYCWTLTPFIFDRVFELDPDADRVTYVDADLAFFSDPQQLFDELEAAGKNVLITEHAYDPEYDQTASSGRFCVQFVTFTRSEGARHVRQWWQDRCVEWCYDRAEDGKFGDQKYLDSWPDLFGSEVHVLGRKDLALAPWNVRMFESSGATLSPVFFHFHGLRLVSSHWLRLWWGYQIGPRGRTFYKRYVDKYQEERARLSRVSFVLEPSRVIRGPVDLLRVLKNYALRKTSFAKV
jgi:hypothetical protein